MSCKSKWQEYNDQLQAATQLALGAADAAPRCIKPECHRPLLKDGTCVMGHPQTPGVEQRALPPLVDALRCVALELVAEVAQRYPYSHTENWGAVKEARGLFGTTNIRSLTGDPGTLQELLRLIHELRGHAYYATSKEYKALAADPRIQATVAAVLQPRLEEAERLVQNSRPGDRHQRDALSQFAALEDLATNWSDKASADRARKGRQQILPVETLPLASQVLAAQLNAAVGGTIAAGAQAQHTILAEQIALNLAAPSDLDFYPGEAGQLLRQELGVTIAPEFWQQQTFQVNVPIARVIPFLWRRIREMNAAVDDLVPQQKALAAASQLTPVERTRQHALPLYQAAAQMQERLADTLRAMGAPGEAILQRLIQIKKQALQSLGAVPLREWPQALAPLQFPPRVLDLLKFKAVRDAVCDPRSDVDLLGHLPQLAPRTVAALKGCELVETLLQQVRGQNRWYPQTAEDAAALVQADRLLRRVAERNLAAQAGEPNNPGRWRQAVATLVDALSEHAPPDRLPLKGDGDSYDKGSRLEQARESSRSMWGAGRYSRHLSLPAVRQWADAAAMPLGRYADRDDIVEWLQSPDADGQAQKEKTVRNRLQNVTQASMRAVDRTGTDRLYKKGQRVRVSVAGGAQEGVVTDCLFMKSAETEPAPYGGTIPLALYPAVEVQLPTGQSVQLPIAEIEVVKKK